MAISPAPAVSVPFVDLSRVHRPLRERLLSEIGALLDSGEFVNGPPVAEFERRFADYCGRAHCVGVASGLDALRLGLIAAGIEPGDEVLVSANTFFATFEAITQAGGVPVPVDADDYDGNIDVTLVGDAVSPRARFIVPVHLYGRLADMVALRAVADRFGLTVIEDACQAHGAVRGGVRPAELALGAAFSFYPGKNLGALGDAGAFVTDDEELAGRVRALREHGQREKYVHETVGYTARLDSVQAAALLCKLPHLDRWNRERCLAAAEYVDRLAGVGDLVLPKPSPDGGDVWHLFVVRTKEPDELCRHLYDRGIGGGRHYPEPPHLSRAYTFLGHGAGSFPVAERLSREVLSLPLFPGISTDQIRAVVRAVQSYFDG